MMVDAKQLVDEAETELRSFDDFFQGLGNSPMSGFEKAILRTYLLAKATGQFPLDHEQTGTSPPSAH